MLDGHWKRGVHRVPHHAGPHRLRYPLPLRAVRRAGRRHHRRGVRLVACESCHGPRPGPCRSQPQPPAPLTDAISPETETRPSSSRSTSIHGDRRRSAASATACGSTTTPRTSGGPAATGLPYRPPATSCGDTRFVVSPRSTAPRRTSAPWSPPTPSSSADRFWRDGTHPRVGAASTTDCSTPPCFRDAETPERTLSCFSCHTMHKTPDDPRTVAGVGRHPPGVGGHGRRRGVPAVSRAAPRDDPRRAHPARAGVGGQPLLQTAHMPYTSYGLLKAIRSHTVGSPFGGRDGGGWDGPNACNLCHLDKRPWRGPLNGSTRGTAFPPPPLRDGDRTVAAGAPLDAGRRRRPAGPDRLEHGAGGPAQEASGTTWMVPPPGRGPRRPLRRGAVHRGPARCAACPATRTSRSTSQGPPADPRRHRGPRAPGVAGLARRPAPARTRAAGRPTRRAAGSTPCGGWFDARDRRPLFLRE